MKKNIAKKVWNRIFLFPHKWFITHEVLDSEILNSINGKFVFITSIERERIARKYRITSLHRIWKIKGKDLTVYIFDIGRQKSYVLDVLIRREIVWSRKNIESP